MEKTLETADDLLRILHQIIDKKFNRKKKMEKIDPDLLKQQLTLWNLTAHLCEYSPAVILKLFKELINRGSITSNIADESVLVLDVYFIPTTEL